MKQCAMGSDGQYRCLDRWRRTQADEGRVHDSIARASSRQLARVARQRPPRRASLAHLPQIFPRHLDHEDPSAPAALRGIEGIVEGIVEGSVEGSVEGGRGSPGVGGWSLLPCHSSGKRLEQRCEPALALVDEALDGLPARERLCAQPPLVLE